MTDPLFAKQSLGQNWLINEGVLDRVIEAAAITKADTVLEIGPGKGTLTKRLAATGARIIAIEKDSRLVPVLQEQFASASNIQIIEGDALTLDPTSYKLLPASYKVVANLPYYITSHFLRRMLESWPSPTVAVLMIQEEVAKRIMAQPPEMSLLALSVQLYAHPSLVMYVSRGSFRPVPDVDSAVIKLDIPPANEQIRASHVRILDMARVSFGQKRKQIGKFIPAEALARASVASTARPQELSVDQWRALAATP